MGTVITGVIYINMMTNSDNTLGNYGVPDVYYVNEFGYPEFHYQWFTSLDDALDYAYQLNDTPLDIPDPMHWCAIDGIITYDV